jgi:hypothetical protein
MHRHRRENLKSYTERWHSTSDTRTREYAKIFYGVYKIEEKKFRDKRLIQFILYADYRL